MPASSKPVSPAGPRVKCTAPVHRGAALFISFLGDYDLVISTAGGLGVPSHLRGSDKRDFEAFAKYLWWHIHDMAKLPISPPSSEPEGPSSRTILSAEEEEEAIEESDEEGGEEGDSDETGDPDEAPEAGVIPPPRVMPRPQRVILDDPENELPPPQPQHDPF